MEGASWYANTLYARNVRIPFYILANLKSSRYLVVLAGLTQYNRETERRLPGERRAAVQRTLITA